MCIINFEKLKFFNRFDDFDDIDQEDDDDVFLTASKGFSYFWIY